MKTREVAERKRMAAVVQGLLDLRRRLIVPSKWRVLRLERESCWGLGRLTLP